MLGVAESALQPCFDKSRTTDAGSSRLPGWINVDPPQTPCSKVCRPAKRVGSYSKPHRSRAPTDLLVLSERVRDVRS